MSRFDVLKDNFRTAEELAVGKEVVDFFRPDLSEDSSLYDEVDSNNGIAIAQSKHELANIMRMRLQEVKGFGYDVSQFSDDTILDAMFTKNDEIEDIYSFARQQEAEFIQQRNEDLAVANQLKHE